MNEQIIILIFLVLALGATLWLYILKAKKQRDYRLSRLQKHDRCCKAKADERPDI